MAKIATHAAKKTSQVLTAKEVMCRGLHLSSQQFASLMSALSALSAIPATSITVECEPLPSKECKKKVLILNNLKGSIKKRKVVHLAKRGSKKQLKKPKKNSLS